MVKEEVDIDDVENFFKKAPTHNKNAMEVEKSSAKAVKNHTCNTCDKTYSLVSNLNKHILNHTKSDWKCNNCDYTYIYIKKLATNYIKISRAQPRRVDTTRVIHNDYRDHS